MGDLFMETSRSGFYHFIKKCAVILFVAIIFFVFFFFLITGCGSKFGDSYVAALPLKYKVLVNTESPKIIIVGGSSAGFGIDSNLLRSRTGYNVVNLGLHAGFGPLFNTELAKDHINEGDIVLLGYEYNLSEDSFKKLGDVNLIMQGIDNHLELYSTIPLENMPEILGNLLNFTISKVTANANTPGTYSRSSFDDNGNMILPRDSYFRDYEENKNIYKELSEESLKIYSSNIAYLKELKAFIESKNASVYFIAPPLLKDSLVCDYSALTDYTVSLEQETKIPYISDPLDYLFDKYYMFDTIYHCNKEGEIMRTELLASDFNKTIGK